MKPFDFSIMAGEMSTPYARVTRGASGTRSRPIPHPISRAPADGDSRMPSSTTSSTSRCPDARNSASVPAAPDAM